MKLTDLRPCDNCGGKIAPIFYVLRISQALMNARAMNEQLGMVEMFGGIENPGALEIASVMGAHGDDVVTIMGDKNPSLMDEIFLCQDCVLMKDLHLGLLLEKINEKKQRSEPEES